MSLQQKSLFIAIFLVVFRTGSLEFLCTVLVLLILFLLLQIESGASGTILWRRCWKRLE